MFDLLIKNARIIDGTGAPAFNGDIAVKDGRIAEVFRDSNAGEAAAAAVADASGLCVTPGFIDIHRHADAAVFRKDFGRAELAQGLTTIVNGNCGLSTVPVDDEHRAEIEGYLTPVTGEFPADMPVRDMGEYLDAVGKLGLPLSTYMLAGAGTIRASAAGYAIDRLEDAHYVRIHRSIEKALSGGAVGVSLGLGYSPECFYTTQELIRALEPLKESGIPITVHMRREGAEVVESVREMVEVARALKTPVHISHLKAMGKNNWNSRIPEALQVLEAACAEGLEMHCDVYPYTAGSTQLMHILPPDYLEGGVEATVRRLRDESAVAELGRRIEDGSGFDNIAGLAGWDGIYLTDIGTGSNSRFKGKNLTEIADIMGLDPLHACCRLLAEEHCRITMIDFMASEDDVETILRSPLSNLISDSTYPTGGRLHPRVYGTFTRMIERFVLEKGTLTLEQAVHKMTAKPASVLRLKGKGIIAPGMDADLLGFVPAELHENADYSDPCRESSGMRFVYSRGRQVLQV